MSFSRHPNNTMRQADRGRIGPAAHPGVPSGSADGESTEDLGETQHTPPRAVPLVPGSRGGRHAVAAFAVLVGRTCGFEVVFSLGVTGHRLNSIAGGSAHQPCRTRPALDTGRRCMQQSHRLPPSRQRAGAHKGLVTLLRFGPFSIRTQIDPDMSMVEMNDRGTAKRDRKKHSFALCPLAPRLELEAI